MRNVEHNDAVDVRIWVCDLYFIVAKPELLFAGFYLELFAELKVGIVLTIGPEQMYEPGYFVFLIIQKGNDPIFKNIDELIRAADVEYLVIVGKVGRSVVTILNTFYINAIRDLVGFYFHSYIFFSKAMMFDSLNI